MRSQDSNYQGRRNRRGPRRFRRGGYRGEQIAPKAPVRKTLWQKITGLFSGGDTAKPAPKANGSQRERAAEPRAARKPELIEVTSPKLYVGNLSFDATESDLFDLFSGVGQVKNAEIVSHKYTQKSKGFAFVAMNTIDEARRAVTELHDKEFMGRKLVVSGAKTSDTVRSNRPDNDGDPIGG
jgi:hypothetical protein